VLERLRDGFLMNGAKNALLFKELAQVLKALEQANIPVIVLKGAHLTASVYSHMAVRTMGDIDLLVGRSDLEKSVSRLGDLGYFARTKVTDVATWCETHRHWPRMFQPPPAPGIEIHWALTAPSQFSKIGHQVVVWVSFGVLGLRNEIERAGGRAASQTARAPLRRRFV
jgi:hypothetical protein